MASITGHLRAFTPAELYLLFQQNGLLTSRGKGKPFVKALAIGRFPEEEIDRFVNGEPSLVDAFVQDPKQTLEALGVGDKERRREVIDPADELAESLEKVEERELPVVESKDVLGSLGLHVVSSADLGSD